MGPKTERLTILHAATQRGETMTSVSAGHIILTLTQPVGNLHAKQMESLVNSVVSDFVSIMSGNCLKVNTVQM